MRTGRQSFLKANLLDLLCKWQSRGTTGIEVKWAFSSISSVQRQLRKGDERGRKLEETETWISVCADRLSVCTSRGDSIIGRIVPECQSVNVQDGFSVGMTSPT